MRSTQDATTKRRFLYDTSSAKTRTQKHCKSAGKKKLLQVRRMRRGAPSESGQTTKLDFQVENEPRAAVITACQGNHTKGNLVRGGWLEGNLSPTLAGKFPCTWGVEGNFPPTLAVSLCVCGGGGKFSSNPPALASVSHGKNNTSRRGS